MNHCYMGKIKFKKLVRCERMAENQNELKKGLKPRHVQFIALAGMIGTGIFKGSSDTLSLAGPSVVLAYLIGGLLLFILD